MIPWPTWECAVAQGRSPRGQPPRDPYTVEIIQSQPRFAAASAAYRWQRAHGMDYTGPLTVWTRERTAYGEQHGWGRPYLLSIDKAGIPPLNPPPDLLDGAAGGAL